MTRAVIFDCFGVFVRDGWLDFKEKHFRQNKNLWDQAGELNHKTDAGELTYNDFVKAVAKLANVSEDAARGNIENNVRNFELLNYIKDNLKPNFKLGILSNAPENWLAHLIGEESLNLFDATVLSYEIGVTKPDPKMYQTIVERLGLKPNECVFIDDVERYCQAAQDFGMKAIWYKDNQQLFSDLKPLLQ